MNQRNPKIDEVIEVIRHGQSVTDDQWNELKEKYEYMPDAIYVTFMVKYFKKNPKTTDWKALMNGIETLLVRNADEEQVRVVVQHILEPFSDSAANQAFNPDLIKPFVGPLTRRYLNEYEEFHGSSYRY